MKTNNFSSVSYDNEFRWAYVWQLVIFTLIRTSWLIIASVIIDVVAYIGGGVPFFSNLFMNTWGYIGVNVILFLFEALKYFKRLRTGEYSIVGNDLIVHEQYMSTDINLTIPISQITEVRYSPYFRGWKNPPTTIPYRFLEITIDGKTYMLCSYAHADELYTELRKRIEQNETNNHLNFPT